MARVLRRVAGFVFAAGVLTLGAACSRDSSDERSIVDRLTSSSFSAPDEFSVLPKKPLVLPEDVSTLPQPAPGATNLVDLTPNADAIRAVGGRGDRGAPTASDRALLAATGVGAEGIRRLLAVEDEEFRANNRGLVLDRLFGAVGDSEIYDRVILNSESELLRLRRLGIWVPQPPPEG